MASLEEELAANTKAVNRLADAMEKNAGTGGAAAGKADKPAAGSKTTASKKPKNTVEQMKAAVMSVKEKVGADDAKALIEKMVGKKGAKLADLANLPDKFDATVEAAEALLTPDDADEDADADGDDDI